MRGSIYSRLALNITLCLGLLSCGGDGDSGAGSDAGFDVKLEMRATNSEVRSKFEVAENMVFALTITNRSGGSQVLSMPTSQLFDLAVLPEGSPTPRWRWSFNRTFTPTQTNDTYAPHASVTHIFIWNGVLEDGTQLMPGAYEFRGTLAYPQYASDWRSNHELAAPLKKIAIEN